MQSFGHIAVSNSDLLVDDVASCKAEAYLDLPIHPHLVFTNGRGIGAFAGRLTVVSNTMIDVDSGIYGCWTTSLSSS
jgi:hypothetical protein